MYRHDLKLIYENKFLPFNMGTRIMCNKVGLELLEHLYHMGCPIVVAQAVRVWATQIPAQAGEIQTDCHMSIFCSKVYLRLF